MGETGVVQHDHGPIGCFSQPHRVFLRVPQAVSGAGGLWVVLMPLHPSSPCGQRERVVLERAAHAAGDTCSRL